MNRRRFFQSLGAAILGTAIALKIPEILIPQIPKIDKESLYITIARFNLTVKNPRMSKMIYGISY